MGGAEITGVVVGGFKEGSFFLSMDHYREGFLKKLGFTPFPGTLNIEVKGEKSDFLKSFKPTRIESRNVQGKKFVGVDCYKASVEGVKGAVVLPDIDKHKANVVELVAPLNLKEKLGVKNGDLVKIKLV